MSASNTASGSFSICARMRSAAVTASRRSSKLLILPGARKAVTAISAQSNANPSNAIAF